MCSQFPAENSLISSVYIKKVAISKTAWIILFSFLFLYKFTSVLNILRHSFLIIISVHLYYAVRVAINICVSVTLNHWQLGIVTFRWSNMFQLNRFHLFQDLYDASAESKRSRTLHTNPCTCQFLVTRTFIQLTCVWWNPVARICPRATASRRGSNSDKILSNRIVRRAWKVLKIFIRIRWRRRIANSMKC